MSGEANAIIGRTTASPNPGGQRARIIYSNAETARRHLYVYAARTFQQERDGVVGALPALYKGRWGRWCLLVDAVGGNSPNNNNNSTGRHCYVLSPYDVPPGPLRMSWMEWFEQLREDGCLERMPHLVCYPRTPAGDDGDLVYEVVPSERIADDIVRRHAARRATPALPPVVEFHDLVLRDDRRSTTLRNPPAAGSPLTVSTLGSAKGGSGEPAEQILAVGQTIHGTVDRSGHDDDEGNDENKGDDDDEGDDDEDSLFELERLDNETSRSRKRKRGGSHGSSSSKRGTLKRQGTVKNNEDRGDEDLLTYPPGLGPEICEDDLVPPDSEHVKSLLSQGYKRWGRPTLLPNGLYKRSVGRLVNGYEFDPTEGLIKPMSTSPGTAATGVVSSGRDAARGGGATVEANPGRPSPPVVEVLLPPDSDHVRHLLDAGYVRWGKPTLLPDGTYKRPLGRIRDGYEFDPVEGLIKPIASKRVRSVKAPSTSSARDDDTAVPAPNPALKTTTTRDTLAASALASKATESERHSQATQRAVSSAAEARDLATTKAKILASLPTSYKEKFGRTGIDKNDMSHVTVVSPFDPGFDGKVSKWWLGHLKEENAKGLSSGGSLLFCVRRVAFDEAGRQRVSCELLRPDAFMQFREDRSPEGAVSSRAALGNRELER